VVTPEEPAAPEAVQPPESPPAPAVDEEAWRSVPVLDLEISDRAKQLLVGEGLETIGDVVDYEVKQGSLTEIRGVGQETDEDIKAAIEPHIPKA
jgi:hypothetical protein